MDKLQRIKKYTDYNIKCLNNMIKNNSRDNVNLEAFLMVFKEINKIIEED